MRIFYNQKIYNNFNALLDDPALEEMRLFWGFEEYIKKSSIDLRIFKTPFGSISLLYGPRQIGKTSSLKLFLSQVNDSETSIFFDCSTLLHKTDLHQQLSELIQGKTTLILDEVQSVEGWHLALRALYSEGKLKNCRVWCTGSEARYLLESGERLPGRKGDGITVFARPWSFREYMDFLHPQETSILQNLDYKHLTQRWLDDQKTDWTKYWQVYLKSGGIPRAIAHLHKQNQIEDTVWKAYADWILGTWSTLRTPDRSLSALARRLCETLNSRVSYESLKQGTDIQSANTVKTLLDMQEDHFSLSVLPRFDLQKRKFLPSKLKKVYPLDPFIAQVWAAIGWNIRRLYSESIPPLALDECAFRTQLYRWQENPEVSYLYSETSQAEIDFYFEDCAFELKSKGNPTPKQWAILNNCPQAFVLKKEKIPLMAYLLGEGRQSPSCP